MKLYDAYKKRKLYNLGGPFTDPAELLPETGMGNISGELQSNAFAGIKPGAVPEAPGGKPGMSAGLAGGIGTAAGIAGGILDGAANRDPLTGRQSVGTHVGKGTLQGVAAGSQFGPIGMAAGAVIGGAAGLIGGNKAKKEARAGLNRSMILKRKMDADQSAARIGSDPSLVEGIKGAGYFAFGGELGPGDGPGKIQRKASPEKIHEASMHAKEFAASRGHINAADTYVGDQLPKVTFNGREVGYGSPIWGPEKKYGAVPRDAKVFHYDDAQRTAWYEDKNGDLVETDPRNMYLPQFQPKRNDFNPLSAKPVTDRAITKMADGGALAAPLARMYMNGGKAKPLSSNNTELKGPSHGSGGIYIPEMGAEVEGGETTSDNYVFSKKLGFATKHKPIAVAKGIIEKKPATFERVNTMKRLQAREKELTLRQEFAKSQMR